MIEVGEYVRTKKGIIGKLVMETLTCPEPSEWVLMINKNHQEVIVECTDYPTKHSGNIIDLIEAGDYVNGMEVLDIYKPRDLWEQVEIRVDSRYINFILADEIQTILTKEQMASIEYRVIEGG